MGSSWSEGATGRKREECWLRDQWGYHEDLLLELLENMFEWQQMGVSEGRHREVVLLSGGTHIGCETEVRDTRTNLTIKQLVVGPCADTPLPEFEPDGGDGAGGAPGTSIRGRTARRRRRHPTGADRSPCRQRAPRL